MNRRLWTLLTLTVLTHLSNFAAPAAGQMNTSEVEPNNSKASATALVRPLEPGDTISGDSSIAGDDYFLLQTAVAPSGIYEHTLTVPDGVTARIMGIAVSIDTPRPQDARVIQESNFIPAGQARYIRWYGFGRSERLYVTLSASGSAAYTATYSQRVITPQTQTFLQPGPVSLGVDGLPSVVGPRVMNQDFQRVRAAPLPRVPTSLVAAVADRARGLVATDVLDNQVDLDSTPILDFPDVLVAPSREIGPIDMNVVYEGAYPQRIRFQKTEPFQILWLNLSPETPCDGSWVDIGPPGPRQRARMAYDSSSGQTILMGGIAPALSGLGTTVWNGTRWEHRDIDGPRRLRDHAMAYDPIRDQVVLYGGSSADSLSSFLGTGANNVGSWPVASRTTWLFDGAAWQGITSTLSPGERSGPAMAFDAARGNVVLFGSANTRNGFTDLATWIWNGTSWVRMDTPGPSNRFASAMTYDPVHETVVLFGGLGSSGLQLADTWLWNGSAWTQSAAAGPSARSGHSMVFDALIGKVVLIGGTSGPSDPIWEWDGVSWTRAPDPPFRARDLGFASAVYEHSQNRVLVHGVQDGIQTGPSYGTNATWERRAGIWSRIDASPGARFSHAMSLDPMTHNPIAYGGRLLEVVTGVTAPSFTVVARPDMWTWVHDHWQLNIASGPPGLRSGHSLTLDPLRGRTILYGGFLGSFSGVSPTSTWSWDGAAWALASSTGPSPRSYHAAAFDPVSGGILLFGGSSSTGVTPLGDTWRWDGSTWTRLFVSGPSPRVGAAMIADPERGRVVLFGGASSSSVVLSDTWEWDGISWNQMPSLGATPSARAFHSMAYDASTRTVAMIGGEGDGSLISGNLNPVPNSETIWDWNGSTWQPRSAHVLPSPASGGAMVFDPQRGTLLWYGGIGGNTGVGSRLFAFEGAAPTITQQPADVAASLDSAATFSIAGQFEGAAFLWRRNGAALADGPGITGSVTAELRLDPVTAASEGLYDVVIATPCGTRFSRAAALTVRCRADFDLSGAVDPDDMGDYLSCYFAVPPCPRADFDGDGLVSADDLGDFINAYFTACP